MQVYVYKGDWGLASVDYDCLKVLSFIKLSKAPVATKIGCNPYLSPTGLLPYLEDTKNNVKVGGNKIIEYLKAQGYACSDSKNDAVSAGYDVYIYENLFPYFTYTLWGEPKNVEITRMIYAKRMNFPFSFFYPKKYVEKTNDLTETLYNFSLDDKLEMHDVQEMIVNAKKCLNWISDKLGESKQFFLGVPSELDASIYAYLAVIQHHTLPNNELQNHVKNCPNLVKYVEHFTKCFSPEECFSSEDNPANRNQKNGGKTFHTGQEDEENLETKRRRQFFSGLFALISMSAYAFFSGIVQIPKDGGAREILHKIDYEDD